MLSAAEEAAAAAMESDPSVRHAEQAEHEPQSTTAQNHESSSGGDTRYAVVVKYDSDYVKSNEGILRLLHTVGSMVKLATCSVRLVTAV